MNAEEPSSCKFSYLLHILCTKIALGKRNVVRKSTVTFLKPKQVQCLLQLIPLKEEEASDLIAILPTGYGKSLIFELHPFMYDARAAVLGLATQFCSTLVISPLNSILNEQIERLGGDALHVTEGFGPGSTHEETWKDNIHQLGDTQCKYVFGHPEHLLKKSVLDVFGSGKWQQRKVLIVEDEAHCVVKWGPQFRPSFQELYRLKAVFPSAQLLALTATATSDLVKELVKSLHLKSTNVRVISGSVDRANIKLEVKKRLPSTGKTTVEESFEAIFEPLISELKKKSDSFPKTIVYSNLKWCGHGHEMAVRSETDGSPSQEISLVGQFHKPCTQQMEIDVWAGVQKGYIRLLFASEAYSMGTDVTDIERIVHAGPPYCLEILLAYLQEVGRAGRDGRQAVATQHYNASDISPAVTSMTDDMREYCKLDTCRRKYLCSKFDSSMLTIEDRKEHMCCDVCQQYCRCDTCNVTDHEDAEASSAVGRQPRYYVERILNDYFSAENRISTGPTGLTATLARDIADNCLQLDSIESLVSIYKLDYDVALNV